MIRAGAVMVWAGAVMIWAGAVMIWAGACSNTNFPTLKMPKNAKKAKCDGRTDRPTDTVAYRSRVRDKNSFFDSPRDVPRMFPVTFIMIYAVGTKIFNFIGASQFRLRTHRFGHIAVTLCISIFPG